MLIEQRLLRTILSELGRKYNKRQRRCRTVSLIHRILLPLLLVIREVPFSLTLCIIALAKSREQKKLRSNSKSSQCLIQLIGELATSLSKIGAPMPSNQTYGHIIVANEQMASVAHSQLRVIFAQGRIASIVQAILNETITNDKFCTGRMRQLQLVPTRPAGRDEIKYPSEVNEMECSPQEDIHEGSGNGSFGVPPSRQPTPSLDETSLLVLGPMECGIKPRRTLPPYWLYHFPQRKSHHHS